MLGSLKKFTSTYHPQTDGMVERLDHTMSNVVVPCRRRQNNWDDMLLHAISAHNNNVSRGTGLAPNEIHIDRYPRLPMIILAGSGAKAQQSEKRHQLDFIELMRDRHIKLTT